MIKMKNYKKSQEEMIGFVLIMVIMAIVAVVFLAISMQKSPQFKTSGEITNFLESVKIYSADCSKNIETIQTFEDLIDMCSKGEDCNNKSACDILNKTSIGLIKASFILKEQKYKGYDFTIYVANQTLLKIREGNSSSGSIYSSSLLTSMQDSRIELKLFIGS